jgi:hypothetical protein
MMTTDTPPATLGTWVPCSDQLPESGATVLVWRAAHWKVIRRGHVAITRCRYTKPGPIWDCDQGQWGLPAFMEHSVTHWMPMPTEPDTSLVQPSPRSP